MPKDHNSGLQKKVDKLNEADGMISQTEKQIKEFGDKLSDRLLIAALQTTWYV